MSNLDQLATYLTIFKNTFVLVVTSEYFYLKECVSVQLLTSALFNNFLPSANESTRVTSLLVTFLSCVKVCRNLVLVYSWTRAAYCHVQTPRRCLPRRCPLVTCRRQKLYVLLKIERCTYHGSRTRDA